jgi:hypothetical protein
MLNVIRKTLFTSLSTLLMLPLVFSTNMGSRQGCQTQSLSLFDFQTERMSKTRSIPILPSRFGIVGRVDPLNPRIDAVAPIIGRDQNSQGHSYQEDQCGIILMKYLSALQA